MINTKELKKIPVDYKRTPPHGQSPHRRGGVLAGRGTGKSVSIRVVGEEPVIISSSDGLKFKEEEEK